MSRFNLPAWSLAALTAVTLVSVSPTAPPAPKPARRSVAAVIAELGDALPDKFDIYPSDPCAGV